MTDEFRQILSAHPEVEHHYETNENFRSAIDEMCAAFVQARELPHDEHLEFLKWTQAFLEEWTA